MGDGGGGRKITIEWLQIAFTFSGRGLICFILYKKTMEKKNTTGRLEAASLFKNTWQEFNIDDENNAYWIRHKLHRIQVNKYAIYRTLSLPAWLFWLPYPTHWTLLTKANALSVNMCPALLCGRTAPCLRTAKINWLYEFTMVQTWYGMGATLDVRYMDSAQRSMSVDR